MRRPILRILAVALTLVGLLLLGAGATLPIWQPRLLAAIIEELEVRSGAEITIRDARPMLDGRVEVADVDVARGELRGHCRALVVRVAIGDALRGIARLRSVTAAECTLERRGMGAPADILAATRGVPPLVPDFSEYFSRFGAIVHRVPDIDIAVLHLGDQQRSAVIESLSVRGDGTLRVSGSVTVDQPMFGLHGTGFTATLWPERATLQLLDPLRHGLLRLHVPEIAWTGQRVVLTQLSQTTAGGDTLGNIDQIELSGTRQCPRVRVRGASLTIPDALLPEAARSRTEEVEPETEASPNTADGTAGPTERPPDAAGDETAAPPSPDAGPSPGQRATAQLTELVRRLDARLQGLPSERCFELEVAESRVTAGRFNAEIRGLQRSADGLLRADGRLNSLDIRVDADGRRLEWAELAVSGVNISRMFGGDSSARSQGDVAFGGRITRTPGRSIQFVGATSLRDAGFAHAGVSPLPLEGINAQLNMRASISLDAAPEILVRVAGWVEEVPVTGHLELRTMDGRQRLQLEMGVAGFVACDAMWRAIPAGLLPNLTHDVVTFGGEASPRISIAYELARPDSFSLTAGSFLSGCVVERVRGEFNPRQLNDDDYVHHVTEGTTLANLEVGPGTDSYVRLDQVPGYLPAAMYLSEEINFFTNHGVSVGLINRGMRLNLERMRYAYGGSTVSQQLVKNLFLSRSKTLSRKLEEAVLVMAMEQWVSKYRILELYMNCIEFGPNIYGIQNAARYYFGMDASELTPLEAVYLANLKPSPLSGGRHLTRGHTPDTGWWIERTPMMLQRLVDYGGFIESDEVNHYAPWVVALPGEAGNPSPLYPRILRPATPATKGRRTIYEFVTYTEPT